MKMPLILTVMTVISMNFFSCDKDEKKSKSPTIVGKWQMVSNSNEHMYEPCYFSGWIQFALDGEMSDYDACDSTMHPDSGTWTVTGETLTITPASVETPVTTLFIRALTDSSLVLFNAEKQNEVATYKKLN